MTLMAELFVAMAAYSSWLAEPAYVPPPPPPPAPLVLSEAALTETVPGVDDDWGPWCDDPNDEWYCDDPDEYVDE